MREIGRDDDQRLGPAPDRVEHGGGRLRRSLAGDDWDQVEFAEHHLQEWQVNLERMFSCMGCIEHADQLGQALGQGAVDRHDAQRCLPGLRRIRRQPMKADIVRRPEQNDAPDALPRRGEPAISGPGDGPGIDITGMRRDQRFRHLTDRGVGVAAEEFGDLAAELGGGGRVEHAGDGGGTNGGQGWVSNKMLPKL